jgi:hypothetical protein
VHEHSKVDFQLFGLWNCNQLCRACFDRCVVAFEDFECFESCVGKEAIPPEDIYLLANTGIKLISTIPHKKTE